MVENCGFDLLEAVLRHQQIQLFNLNNHDDVGIKWKWNRFYSLSFPQNSTRSISIPFTAD